MLTEYHKNDFEKKILEEKLDLKKMITLSKIMFDSANFEDSAMHWMSKNRIHWILKIEVHWILRTLEYIGLWKQVSWRFSKMSSSWNLKKIIYLWGNFYPFDIWQSPIPSKESHLN